MCPQESSTLFGRFCIHVALIVGERHLGIHHHVPVIGEVQDEVGYQSLAFIVLQSLSKTVTKRLLRIKLLSLVQLHILEQLPELQFAKVSLHLHFTCKCSGKPVCSFAQSRTLLHVGLYGGIQSVECLVLLFLVLVQCLAHLLQTAV